MKTQKHRATSLFLAVSLVFSLVMLIPAQGIGLTFSSPRTPEATATPAGGAAPTAEEPLVRYGKTNIQGVNVRAEAKAKADIVTKVSMSGTYLLIEADEKASDGTAWYKVVYAGEEGYIRADLVDEIEMGTEDYQKAQVAVEEQAAAASKASGSGS